MKCLLCEVLTLIKERIHWYCMHWINVYLCVEGPMVMTSRAVGKPSEMLTKVSFAAGERITLMLISTLDNDAKN